MQQTKYCNTVKPVLFTCPLFRDLDNLAKITDRYNILAAISYRPSSVGTDAEIKGAKIII